MTTVERLINATKEIWKGYSEHPFVKGIESGTLDRDIFRYYIIQDYLYLMDYAKVFAIGVAKAKSPEIISVFSKYLSLLTESEMDIHHGYMGRLSVSREEIDKTPMAIDNLSYTSFMLRVAYEDGEAEILAAILSCAYSYEIIAKRMVADSPDCVNHDFYGEWIKGYSSSEYADGNTVLIETLNKLTESYTERELKHITDIFTACSEYEAMFWDLSLNISKQN